MTTLQTGCNLIGEKEKDDDNGIAPPSPVYPQPYAQPSVSVDGEKLLFIRNKIIRVTRGGFYTIDFDSSGIWMANTDGMQIRMSGV